MFQKASVSQLKDNSQKNSASLALCYGEKYYFCGMRMNKLHQKHHPSKLLRRLAGLSFIGLILYSCASVGRIEGGPYDETPPVFLKGSPAPGALQTSKKKIVLEFDEFIKLDKPSEKVIISPPQIQQPEVKSNGKKVVITLQDTLKANTTYTIDFGDAIQDNNEGNPLENFFYTFSTGERLDTMAVAGTVLNAMNLEPIKGMLVGLHSNLADSAFTTTPFDRVGRTDSRGHFSIRGVAPGSYRIYALQDADQNVYFSQPAEAIAFQDSLIIPSMEWREREDTTWVDSLTIDTIVHRRYIYYLPDDILLRSFKEIPPYNRRLMKSERPTPKDFNLYFNAVADTLPRLRGLNFDATDAFIVEMPTGKRDTLHYWIRDSLIYKIDTLKMELTYFYTDTLQQLVNRIDTLQLVSKQRPKSEKELEKERKEKEKERERRKKRGEPEEEKTKFLEVDLFAPSSIDIYDYLTFTFKEPVARFDTAAVHLRHKVDTLWYDMPYEFEHDSTDIMRYNLYADWSAGESYSIEVDSMAITGIYGLFTDKIKREFKAKTLEEYGQIFFNVIGADSIAFVELLDASDKVVRTVPVTNGRADFYYLAPGKYGARLINDTNGNGVWDTGNYSQHLQPEKVCYYHQILELKANFDLTQDWFVNERTPDRQKPEEMKKQKPDEDRKKKQREERNRQRNGSSNSSRNSGRSYSY